MSTRRSLSTRGASAARSRPGRRGRGRRGLGRPAGDRGAAAVRVRPLALPQLDLVVDPRVLIPRPETEQVVEVALGEARRLLGLRPGVGLVAVDAGTGSGAIALALATELGAGAVDRIWATDTSADALEVAAVNLEAMRPAGQRVACRRWNWSKEAGSTLCPKGGAAASTWWCRTRLRGGGADEWSGLDP